MAFSWTACKEDCKDPSNPDCENYDPCHVQRTINSVFRVRPGDRGFPPPEEWCDLIPCDTFNASSVRFDAPDGNPEDCIYEWQIGTEAEPRIGKAFEVDFSDYLNDGHWESWIPVTLTIHTPRNECLDNPKDTLVKVTRELFFTDTLLSLFSDGDNKPLYKGFFNVDPNNEKTVQFLNITEGDYRGVEAPIGLVVGIPGIDTLLYPKGCPGDWCGNYVGFVAKLFNSTDCTRSDGINLSELSYFLKEYKLTFKDGINTIKYSWVIDRGAGPEEIMFTGKRIK